ncbi:hypothetical protein SAMN04487910_1555 [Aquimarina amphilecti]|uniref:Lipoprotein n=1 Tax=Aquimarina amphilecti TaxID=1038014 RepID=A0A1H7M0C3_AQUAM|nr:hypothetical protein [Aquimarina amphilecti]SEL04644.1 hypothetical protein SAMN04487910_1555 [Aquimarina amphilecti]
MKKLLICTVGLGLMASCAVEDVEDTVSIQNSDKENFEMYHSLDGAMDGFDLISEAAFDEVQSSSKSSKSSCVSIELLVSNEETPLSGFEEYDYYSKMILNYTEEQCQFDDWSGKLEYYVAGVFNEQWKDSTVFKNVRGDEGYMFDGYRVAEQNPDLSTGTTKVFDVIIDGVITEPNGDSYRYTTNRNFTFENRFTADEVIILEESSLLEGITQTYFMKSESVANAPLVYKVACFNRFNFLKYPVQGALDFTSSFGVNFNIDFGDGSCDKEVTLTGDNGESIVFDL